MKWVLIAVGIFVIWFLFFKKTPASTGTMPKGYVINADPIVSYLDNQPNVSTDSPEVA